MIKKSEKRKKTINKKKKVIAAILFIFFALIVGTTVHTLFLKDTTESKTIDDTEVVENETYKNIPKDNSTPADYSPEENISICQSVIQNMDAWTSKTEGTAVADVLFMNYTQNISARKVIKDGSATQQSASESSLLSTGQQRTFKDDAILIRNAKKVKSMDDIEWEDDFTAVSKETYAQNYGRTPFALTNYVIDKTTIIKSKKLDSDKDMFKYEYELKPAESTVYYKRQMRTEGGASDYPTFHRVKVTVTMDKQWRPLVIHYSENYDISIAVVGDVTCQGEITETFSDFGEVKALPNQDLVDDFIKNKYDKNKLSDLPTKGDTDISKYITEMFAKKPYYHLNLSVDNTKLDMDMYVNMNNGTIKIKGQDLFAAYANKKVYLQYENVKVSMKADSIFEAVKIIGNAVNLDTKSIDFDYLTNLDLNHISLDDKTVSGLLNDVKLKQSDDAIQVAFAKDGIQADVKVTLKDESVSLAYAKVSLKSGGHQVKASITTTNKSDYPNLKGFNDISKVTTLLQPWIDTIQAKGVVAKVSLGTSDIKLSGKAMIGYKPLKLNFTTKIDGVKIKAIVVKKTVYIRAGNIKVKCKLKNIESTIKKIMVMVGIDIKKNNLVPKQYADTIQQLKDGNINIKKLIKSVKSVSFKKGYLNIHGKINQLELKLAVSKDTIKVKQGKKLTAKAKITKKYKKSPKVSVKKSQYVSTNVILKSLSKLGLYKLLKSKGIILDTTISGNGFTLKGVAKAVYNKGFQVKYTTNIEGVPVTLIYKNDVIYVKSGKVMVKGSSKYTYKLLKNILKKAGVKLNNKTLLEAESFGDAFNSLIKEYAGNFTIKDIIGNVKTFQYKKGYLIVQYKYAKNKVVTIKLKKKTLSLSAAVLDMNFNAKLKIKKIYTKSPVISVNSKAYTKLSDIIEVLEKLGLEELIASTGIDTDVNLNIGGKNIKANIKANYENETTFLLSTNITEGKTTIPITVTYVNHLFYIDIANIHAKTTMGDIEQILSKVLEGQSVSKIFAKDLSTVIKELAGELSAKDIISSIQSFSCDDKTLKIQYRLKNDTIGIAITGRTITVDGLKLDKNKLSISAKINNTKKQNIIVNHQVQYIDVKDACNLIKNNIDSIENAKALGLKANIQFGAEHISADIIYDKSANACKVMIPYNNEMIEAAYVDDVIYVHLGKFYIKATKEKLLELIKEYSGYELDRIFAGNNIKEQLSLALVLNIQKIALKDGKLIVDYVQNETAFKVVLESQRDEIDISGVKIGEISMNGNIVLDQFFDKEIIDKKTYQDNKYLDLNKVLEIIDIRKIEELLQAKGMLLGVKASINDYEIAGELQVAFGEKIACQFNTVIEGIDTILSFKDNNLYVNASNLHLVYENISETLSAVVQDGDLSQIIDKITDIHIVDDQIVIGVLLEGNRIEVAIAKEQIHIITEIKDTRIDVLLDVQKVYDSEPDIQIEKANYNKITDIINVLKTFGVSELINSTGIEADVQFYINETKVSVKLIYVNGSFYLQAGNVYIKTSMEYILSLLKENGVQVDTGISVKDIVEHISELQCDGQMLSFKYNGETPLDISISNKTIRLNDFVQGEIIDTKVTEVKEADKYVDLKTVIEFVKKWKNQPAVTFRTSIKNKELSVVYENKTVYVEFDGLKLMSDDSSIASIINAVLKIYNIDITPALEWIGIVEDEKDINLEMFRQYTDADAISDIVGDRGLDFAALLENIKINGEEISYEGNFNGSDIALKLYDSTAMSSQPDTKGYIDVSSADTLLKAFGETATNMNFDVSGKASLALNLGLFDINLKDVPLSVKLKVEKEGVYGNVHVDVPYMKSITDSNVSVPETTTETTESTSKTKTEVKTSYSLVSDSEKITTDFFVTPEYIYIHKNVQYELQKTVATTKYKKVLLWIPQSTTKETETVKENKDFYIKRTYQEMQDNIMSDLCFALNMSDSMKDKILDSSNRTDVEGAALGNIVKSYSFDKVSKFVFGLNLSGLTNGAITNTDVDLYKNSEGYLKTLHAECKLYSLIAIKLDADLNHIGQPVDIGFDPSQLKNDKNYK